MNNTDNNAIKMPQRIGFLLIEGFALMSFASAVEPLRAANLLGEGNLYEILGISDGGERVFSSSGAEIHCQPYHETLTELDMLLVVAGGDPLKYELSSAMVAWLKMLDRRGVTIGGVSGGPAILVRAGLMRDRRMTVHWEHAPSLREIEPEILLEPALYLTDRNRITCAGGTAPLDLMHSLIAEAHGNSFAQLVSDWFMHTEFRHWRQPQRAGLVERHGTTNRALLNALQAMEDHVADPLSLGQIARIAEVGERQLNRLFAAEFDASAMSFYRSLRIGVASSMLTGSSLPLVEIALATGFADASHFSRAFKSVKGVAPAAFRRQSAGCPPN